MLEGGTIKSNSPRRNIFGGSYVRTPLQVPCTHKRLGPGVENLEEQERRNHGTTRLVIIKTATSSKVRSSLYVPQINRLQMQAVPTAREPRPDKVFL